MGNLRGVPLRMSIRLVLTAPYWNTPLDQPLPTGYKGIPFIIDKGDCRRGVRSWGVLFFFFFFVDNAIFHGNKALLLMAEILHQFIGSLSHYS